MLLFWHFLFRARKERNETIVFIFSLSHLLSTYFGSKCSHNGIFLIFLNFFAFFLEFSITRWVGTKLNEKIYFLSFSAFSKLFWLYMKPCWHFLIFLQFVWNFQLSVRLGRNETIIFIFSLSQPFSTDFELKLSHNGIFFIFLLFF